MVRALSLSLFTVYNKVINSQHALTNINNEQYICYSVY